MAPALLPRAPMRWVRASIVTIVALSVGTWGLVDPPRLDGAEGGGPNGPSLRIERLEIASGGTPAVRATLSGPAAPVGHALAADADHPPRVFVDVPGARLDPKLPRSLEGGGIVRGVRVAERDGAVARIVIDLAEPATFQLETTGHVVTIALVRAETGSVAATAEMVGPPAPPAVVSAAGSPAVTAPALAAVNGVPYVWPTLDAAEYDDANAAQYRRVIEGWQRGIEAVDAPAPAQTPPALYLAADLAFLRAAARNGDFFAAIAAYEHALRTGPALIDAPRAQLMLGFIHLHLGLAPEAETAFRTFAQRHSASPLAPYARIGEAAALRLRNRPEEARRRLREVLAGAPPPVWCQARLEEAAQQRASGRPADALAIYRDLVPRCPTALAMPGALHAYADCLALTGERAAARAVLAARRDPLGDAEEARLAVLAGRLAEEDGDRDAATAAYGRVMRLTAPERLVAEARFRQTRLTVGDDPERAANELATLSRTMATPGLRAALLGEAAEANARAGRFEEALTRLDEAAALGPEGRSQADGRRRELLGRWVANLATARDDGALTTVYAAYATQIDSLAAPEDRLAIAAALGRLGLHGRAVRLLALGTAATETEVALAEAALLAGEGPRARRTAVRLLATDLPPPLAARARRTAVRAALAAGDLMGASELLGSSDDATLRAEVASALAGTPGGATHATALLDPLRTATDVPAATLVGAGDAATAAGAWETARDLYRGALGAKSAGSLRPRASAGLARAALALGDPRTAVAALDAVATSRDPAVRAAAAAVARAIGGGDAR